MKDPIKFMALVLLLVHTATSLIEIKRLSNHELQNFVLYRSRSLISSYKTEEKVQTPTLLNYLPVKIKLLNNPTVEIKETPDDQKTKLK